MQEQHDIKRSYEERFTPKDVPFPAWFKLFATVISLLAYYWYKEIIALFISVVSFFFLLITLLIEQRFKALDKSCKSKLTELSVSCEGKTRKTITSVETKHTKELPSRWEKGWMTQ